VNDEMKDKWEDLQDKLQEIVLEEYSENLKREFLYPQNIGKIDNSDSWSRITGVCGDTVEIFLSIEQGMIKDIKFWTDGCGFTIVCCSYVTRTVKKKTIEEAYQKSPEEVDEYFGGLPEENKHCAHLSVNTLRAAIEKYRNLAP